MKLDEIIAHLEADYSEYLTGLLVEQLLSYLPSWFLRYSSWFLNPVLGFVFGLAVSKAVKKIDLGAYAVFKGEKNAIEATKYEQSALAYDEAAESGDEDAIKEAKARKRAHFIALFSLTQ